MPKRVSKHVSSNALDELIEALDLGLGVVTRVWTHPAKDWVTSVFATDIDHNGNPEITACSRDGRVRLLSNTGELLWERVIGMKVGIGTGIATDESGDGTIKNPARIIVGTRDGKVFVLDRLGHTITKDGELLPFEADGRAYNLEQEEQAYWHDTGSAIRQIALDHRRPNEILFGSQDRCAYGVDYTTGALLWRFPTNGWVRAVCSGDVNGDGQDKILVGSVDRHLYLLDQKGNQLASYPTLHPVLTIDTADIDNDGKVEILVTTEGKDLIVLNYIADATASTGIFQEKWRHSFGNRVLSLCVIDIDGDGKQEIIVGSEDQHIYFLDDRGDTIWRHNHRFRVFSLCPCDTDNNGLPELIIGSSNNRVSVMRIRLRKGIDKKIDRAYKQLGEPDPEKMAGLSAEQRALLLDVLGRKSRQLVTSEQAQEQLDMQAYQEALSTLISLERQRVEQFWQSDIAYIRTVCLRQNKENRVREVVVGTSTGDIYDFSADGTSFWVSQLNDHIVDVQTGFVDRRRKEEIIICTSDRQQIYIVDGENEQRQVPVADAWMSSVCVTPPDLQGIVEIIVGSEEKKLYIYRGDSQDPVEIIDTEEGVRIVRANTQMPGQTPQIVTASLINRVYAYTRQGERLWYYETRDRIQAVCIKDINHDGKLEILIGSEDHNIHVLDGDGNLLWRYYLPDRVLAVDATEGDGNIFVGCADGYLYVFSKDGNLLWTYQAKDRIHALCVADIDGDDQLEIILGTEDQLDVLRIVNQQDIQKKMEQCWQALCQRRSGSQVINALLTSANPFLQIFALRKLAEQGDPVPRDFDRLENLASEGAVEVRKELIHTIMTLYSCNPPRARALLFQLSTNFEQEVRGALIEHIQMLINHDWDLGFNYLKRAAYDPDRYMRRLVVRALYRLMDNEGKRSFETRKEVFKLLLAAMQDKESEWICQEATRSMSHLLNQQYGKLIISLHLFIVKGIARKLWDQIAHGITNPDVKLYLEAVIEMVFGLNEENAPENISRVVDALQTTEPFDYGPDIQLIYDELHRLFTIKTVAGIANYRCKLNGDQFNTRNMFAPIILEIFNKLGVISRPLRMYLWREGIQDQQASLQEALTTIEQARKFVEQQYTRTIMDESITALPDHQAFLLLLEKWRRLVQEKLEELRGTAELKVELQTKDTHYDHQIGIWLNLKNVGRGVAMALRITLLRERDDKHFAVVDSNHIEVNALFPGEEITVEFTIEPHCTEITLKFDIAYDDIDSTPQVQPFEDSLTLRETDQEFYYIPNPYSTGTPMHDEKMFYGRDADIAYLQSNLAREAKSVVVLYGQRRLGKTTILLQLANTALLGEHIPVLIDMQRISYVNSIDTLLHRIAYFIGQAMRKRNITSGNLPPLEDFKAEATYTFDLFLDQIEEHLMGRKLILMIDEFEVLEDLVDKGKLQRQIFDYLRDIVQHRPQINFLFSGTHRITEYTRRYYSVFFNTALHRRLSRLPQQAAEGLILKPVEGYLEYEPLTVTKIHQLTADQPYLIHLMCRAIVDYCNGRGKTFVTINDVNTVLREVMQTGQFHFEWLWQHILPEEQLALAALAEGGKEEGRWLSLTEIEEIYSFYNIRFKREHIQEALKGLTEEDFVENKSSSDRKNLLDSNKFRIPVGLTRIWLLKEHPLEVVRRQMGD